ncbi:MAG: hypothetical protein ABL898_16130 [Hyphomicrobiaceae bacterium]|nr:hypothetical protein [Hyphomicrobiaceae bacterium]
MHDDRVTSLSMGIAVVLAAHGVAAWLGYVKGPVWPQFVAAILVAGFVLFKK